MDDGSRSGFLAALILLFFAMICAVTETSIASVSRVKVKTASDRGDRKAARVLYVLDHFEKAITTILICTNIVHLSIASIVTTAVTRRWGLSAVSLSTIITTFAVFYAGEMLPKSVAKKYSFYFSKATSGILLFFMKILSPLSAALAALSAFVSTKKGGEGEKTVTEDELQDIIEDMTEEGSLDEDQGELVSSALQFVEVTVQDILTPRVDMVALGRQFFADPAFPNKAAEGRADEIRRCLRCGRCYPGPAGEHETEIWTIKYPPLDSCTINPDTVWPASHHKILPELMPKPEASRKVLIVGGGCGGMQAAITAADRGHKVILCEKADVLGGVINFTDHTDHKIDIRNFKDLLIM